MKFNFSAIFVLLLLCLSCNGEFVGSESKLRNCADSFATYYFNYRFQDAMRFCTPQSERWLTYAASNVHQADVDILKTLSEGAGIEVTDVEISDDTTATVRIHVTHFLQMDTIGTSGHMAREATFVLPAVYADKQWKIRMEGLPRSEKSGRD